MSGWDSRDEPELCTEPVRLECAVCGDEVLADPDDSLEDEEEYVCLECTRERPELRRPIAAIDVE